MEKNTIIIDRGSLNVRIKCYYKCRDRYMDTENCKTIVKSRLN